MKTRKILMLVLMTFITLTVFGQSRFDKFQDREDVKVVTVNQNAFKMMANIKTNDAEADEYMELLGNLTNLKIIATENKQIAKEMKEEVSKYLKEEILSELMSVKDGDANVKIYIKDGIDEKHISKLFMFVEELNESVIIDIDGNIDLQKISEITQELNIPHSDKIEK